MSSFTQTLPVVANVRAVRRVHEPSDILAATGAAYEPSGEDEAKTWVAGVGGVAHHSQPRALVSRPLVFKVDVGVAVGPRAAEERALTLGKT